MRKYLYAAMIGIVFGSLCGVASAKDKPSYNVTASEATPRSNAAGFESVGRESPRFRLPGDCVKVFQQVVNEKGQTIIRIQTQCEYTTEQRTRLKKEGK